MTKIDTPQEKVHNPFFLAGADGVAEQGYFQATFWRNGKFERLFCKDCRIQAGQSHTEITLTDPQDKHWMFVITADPEVIGPLTNAQGQSAAFDGFILKDGNGKVIEKITAFDSKTIQ